MATEPCHQTLSSLSSRMNDTRFAITDDFLEPPRTSTLSTGQRDDQDQYQIDKDPSKDSTMDMDAARTARSPSRSKRRPLDAESKKFKKELDRSGVVYMSRIPPKMKPQKVKHLLAQFGEIGRIYLAEEGSTIARNGSSLITVISLSRFPSLPLSLSPRTYLTHHPAYGITHHPLCRTTIASMDIRRFFDRFLRICITFLFPLMERYQGSAKACSIRWESQEKLPGRLDRIPRQEDCQAGGCELEQYVDGWKEVCLLSR